ncbi:HAD family hydrolase [Streptosporangium saharense]|uniref:Beta-phosphoglucomutase-like phosphatase (HAD superfamily) n=1 Tax=Streptosporangium saharense TaxID=1706840 RepID=A0A7W7VPA3_9ACTN|nr:HAD family phosphatase [Streptosporangium saharense]MBB4917473.1 beta-phosphoglucomutase-like phosphatase (HAD superfamily) [Streptosporangium saharense]
MTSTRVRPHVARVLEHTRAVLLPFDGTVCDLFADVDTAAIAKRIRARLFKRGHRMTLMVAITADPLGMMAYARSVGPASGAEAEKIVRDAERAAARTATPEPGIHEVLRACQASGRPVAVMGYTCPTAMESHLEAHDLRHLVGPVIGRGQRRLSAQRLIRQAVEALGVEPSDCALVSQSPEGMFAAEEAGTHAIGVVSRHSTRKQLAFTSSAVVVSSLPKLADAITAVPPA